MSVQIGQKSHSLLTESQANTWSCFMCFCSNSLFPGLVPRVGRWRHWTPVGFHTNLQNTGRTWAKNPGCRRLWWRQKWEKELRMKMRSDVTGLKWGGEVGRTDWESLSERKWRCGNVEKRRRWKKTYCQSGRCEGRTRLNTQKKAMFRERRRKKQKKKKWNSRVRRFLLFLKLAKDSFLVIFSFLFAIFS